MIFSSFRLLFILLLLVYVIIPSVNKKDGKLTFKIPDFQQQTVEPQIYSRTNLFERFHTPMSKKIMTALYPAENDVTANLNINNDFSFSSNSNSDENITYRLDISKNLPVRSVTNPNDKASERLREAFLHYLKQRPDKIPFVTKKKTVSYRKYKYPERGSTEMHEFFKAEQKLEDEDLKFWEDKLREQAAFINAENQFFKRLNKTQQRRILQNGAIVIKAPPGEKDIKNAAYAAVIKNRLKRRNIKIADNEFFIYLNALKTAEKKQKPSVYAFNNEKGYRIVYPENYFPKPDEALDASALNPSQRAVAQIEFQNYKKKTGVIQPFNTLSK